MQPPKMGDLPRKTWIEPLVTLVLNGDIMKLGAFLSALTPGISGPGNDQHRQQHDKQHGGCQ